MASGVVWNDVWRLCGRNCSILRTVLKPTTVKCDGVIRSHSGRHSSCWRTSSFTTDRDNVVVGSNVTILRTYSHRHSCEKYTENGAKCCRNRGNNPDHDHSLPCWKCGRTVDDEKERYFCECGVVQPPVTRRSLFEVMGVKETFDVDLHELTEKYRDLQRMLHPDKYSQKSETEKEFSLQHSSLVNKAYNTLQKPLARGLYLLDLNEDALEHETEKAASEFLDEILEVNEALLEAESVDELNTIGARNQAKIDHLVLKISDAFKNDEQTKARELLIRLRYYSNIADKIKESIQKYVG